MFNVQCPGCSAPYQVDERRVPQGGLRMRCPKCATSFVVDKPASNQETQAAPMTAANPTQAVAPPARASNPLKSTMIGVAAPAPAPPRAAPGRGPEVGAGQKLPPARVDLPSVVSPKAPPPPSRDADMPAVPARAIPPAAKPESTSKDGDFPAVPRPKPPPPARAPAPIESDLPAALGARPNAAPRSPAIAATPTEPRRPAAAPAVAKAKEPDAEAWALPELAKEPPLVTPATLKSNDDDLSFSLPPAKPSTAQPSIDVDLPLHKDARISRKSSDNVTDDLEIALPSPAEAMSGWNQAPSPADFDVELDLPSPAAAGLPAAPRTDLPSTTKGVLPAVAKAKSSVGARTTRGFGEVDLLPDIDPMKIDAGPDPSASPMIPDLDAPLGIDSRTARSRGSSQPPVAKRLDLPDFTDVLPNESLPPSEGEGELDPGESRAAPSVGLEFGDLSFEPSTTAAEFRGSTTGEGSPGGVLRTSGGGTAFGEVSLDESGDGNDLIGTLDDVRPSRERKNSGELEFGGVPQEVAPIAVDAAVALASPSRQDTQASRRIGGAPPAERRPIGRAAKYGSLGLVVVLVLGGAALSLVPDVGLFGYSFISDQIRKPEYERLLVQHVGEAQRALASDLYPLAVHAIETLERAQKSHPRAKGLRSYLGYLGYAVDLRFGASSERSAKSKILLNQLTDKTGVTGLELALAARAAAEGNLARAHQEIDETRRTEPKRVETQVLSAQIEMLDRRPGQSLVYWREVEAIEHSARSAYGSSIAELALGQVEAAEQSAHKAISRQAKHVGARLMLARIAVDKRGDIAAAEKLLNQALEYQPEASPSEQVASLSLLGDLNLARSRISVAESAYEKALGLDPRSSGALRGLGEALYRAGRYAEALARFEAAVQADPDDTIAAIGVAKTQLSLERVRDASALLAKLRASHSQSYLVNYWYGATLQAMGNREEAEKAFSNAIELGGTEPASIDAYISLALLKSQQGRREEAQKLLETAREKLPASPRTLNAIGQLLLSEGRYDAAITDFKQALKLDPTDISARFRLGVALRKNRVFEEAMTCFDEVAKVDHEYPGLALERGLLYENSGRSEEALKSFEDALAKAPNDADLLLRVGCGKVAAGRPKEAEALLQKVLDQRPMSAETHHCLGRAQLLEGTNLALALRTLERAAELDPYRPEYFLYIGWAANEAGRISVAEQALKKALALDQGLGDAYWQRGVLRFRQGAVKDAVADLTKAIELRPNRSEAHAALAEAYYELGMEPKALEQWRIAVAAQPDNASWHFSLGKLLQAASRDAEAKGELEKALQLGAKLEPPPRWIWEAHRLLARSIGSQPAAIPHWQEYLRLAPLDNAYREEAKQALSRLGQPYNDK